MLADFLDSLTQLPLMARFALAIILLVPTLCQKVRFTSVVGLVLAGRVGATEAEGSTDATPH